MYYIRVGDDLHKLGGKVHAFTSKKDAKNWIKKNKLEDCIILKSVL